MLSKKYIYKINKVIVVLGISILVASCGTYEYVGYNNDGIYSEVPSSQRVLTEVQTVETVDSDAGYYKNYFQERKREVEAVVAQSEVFTDVDDYSSDYTQPQDTLAMRTGYSGWGQTNDVVNINFYNNGWNNWGWDPWLWNTGFGWGGGGWPLWNRWGAGWGWNAWGWNAWGWGGFYGPGWGWNGGWGWGGFYGPGWGWGYPVWGVGGYYPYNNNVAFIGSRRGDAFASGYGRTSSIQQNRRSNLNNSSVSRRSSSALPANSNLRRTVEQNNLRRSSNTRMSTRNSIGTRNSNYSRGSSTRMNNTSRGNTRINNSGSSRSSSTTTRSSSSSRSSGGTMSSGGSRGGSMGGGSRGGSSGGGGGRRGG